MSGSSRRPVTVERDGHLATVTLDARGGHDRIDPGTAVALSEGFDACDDDGVWVVLLRVVGRDFCRGIVGRFADWPSVPGTDFVAALARVRQPVVAAIPGRAEAEGLELALAADLRVVSPRTELSMPQVARGSLPSFGGTQRLPRIVGAERALRMLLLGETVKGRRAVDLGLAIAVDPRPAAAAEKLARGLLERGPIALRFAKEAVRRALDLPLDDGARFEHDLYSLLETTRDRAEGVASFLDKRPPRFRGV